MEPRGQLAVLTFQVSDHRCGLPTAAVVEVVRAVAIRPLPPGPAGLEGAIDLRGRVVPVFDLRVPLGQPPRAVLPSDHFVIARAQDRVVALRVDRAEALVDLAPGSVEDIEPVLPGARRIRSVGKLPDGILLVYDLDDFLSPREGAEVDAAVEGALRRGEI